MVGGSHGMRVLVTGGAGYIGSHTVRVLRAAGHGVVVYDNLSAGHRPAVPAEILRVGDLRDIDQLDQLLVVERIEAVVHFAASALVGESVTQPHKYYHNNLLNSLNLLDRCRRHNIQRFVFSSTCATYGIPETVPIPESCPQKPVNPYGNTKLAFEKMLQDYAPAYNIGAVALRYFNAAGASADATIGEHHDPETHLIPIVLQVALGQRPHVEIFGTDYPTPDGTCIRDYIHVDDLAEAHRLALEKIEPGKFAAINVGTGVGASVREIIAVAEKVTGKKIATKEGPRRAGDPPMLVSAGELARKTLGWRPTRSDLESLVASAWEWHRTHPRGYAS
jgi:UDP-glucose 4-epimerase